MQRKPKIGIVGWSTGDGSFGTTKPYLQHLSRFGSVLILTPMGGIIPDLDLVVLPGGRDIPTYDYGRVPGYTNSDADQFKQFFYDNNLKQYIKAGIPIFGTCLGFQMLVVHFGGILQQDISLDDHGYSDDETKGGRGELVNDLIFTPEFSDLEIELLPKRSYKGRCIKTCSLHHQAALKNDAFPEQLQIVAYTADGVVEAIQHAELPIAGMQAHVEEDYNVLGNHLIKSLIERSPNFKDEKQRNTLEAA